MSRTITILKLLGILLALTVAIFGYRYLRVWQQNPSPTSSDVRWNSDTVELAAPAQLQLGLRLPWHRSLPEEPDLRLPDGLVLAHDGVEIGPGRLRLDGFRHHQVQLTLVPTKVEQLDGKAIGFPLVATRRIGPSRLSAGLPSLTIQAPQTVPDAPLHSLELITPDTKIATAAIVPETAPAAIWPWLAVGTVLLLGLGSVLWLRRPRRETPAWTAALHQLDAIENLLDAPADQFFARLTDTIKHYTSRRFTLPADAASSSELLQMIAHQDEVSTAQQAALRRACRHADAAKFAARGVDAQPRRDAITAARDYVHSTTPSTSDAEVSHA